MALRDKEIAEIQIKEKDGIIERKNRFIGLGPPDGCGTKTKKDEVRVCADLRELNKLVIAERFPLSTKKAILAEVEKSMVSI